MGVFRLQGPAVDLSRAEARQRFGRNYDALRDFELGELAVEEGAQFVAAHALPVLHETDRHRHFTQALIRGSEHGGLGDGGAGVAFGLHLRGRPILAAADADLLLAVDDEEVAVLVEIADVAGPNGPVSGQRFRRRRVVSPIAFDVGCRADADLADFARRQLAVAGTEDRNLDQRFLRAPGRGRLGRIAAPEIRAPDRVGFG